MKKITYLVFLWFLAVGFISVPTSFAEEGKDLYVKLTCFGCHGKEGKGMVRKRDRKDKTTGEFKYRKGDPIPGFEAYPKLAGQNSQYLYTQMKDIFEGRRSNGLSAAMKGIKTFIDANATDEDLMKVAVYLSQIK